MSGGLPPLPGPLPSSFDGNEEFYNERPMQKVVRKIKEEPLIPIGMALTTLAFVNSYRALRRGDSKQANRMFRARVAAQAFTVIAMVAGSMYYSKDREKTKELRKLQEQRDAEEKHLKWIRELEVRDQEEKAIKARIHQRTRPADTQPKSDEQATTEVSEGTGGILSRMGLWPKGEKKDAAASAEEPGSASETDKKKNPKSSLGDLGELMSTKKKEDADSKKDE